MQVLNPQLADDLAHDRPVSIAIGAGGERDEGHYTLDIRDMINAPGTPFPATSPNERQI